jgi:hypothetical protein
MTARTVGSAIGTQPNRNVRFSAVIGGRPDLRGHNRDDADDPFRTLPARVTT